MAGELGIGNIFGGFLSNSIGGLITLLTWILVIIVLIGFSIFWYYRSKKKKSFNIPLIILTPRSDGVVTELNTGKGGFFRSKRVQGITTFKVQRAGLKTAEIPPPASKFLIAPNRTLILAQKGLDDYEPVLPSSLTYVLTPEGQRVPILKLKAINQDATAWSYDIAETARKRFTFTSLWDKYQVLITLMVFIFVLFLVLYINWLGMKDVVSGLKDVSISLKDVVKPVVTMGG